MVRYTKGLNQVGEHEADRETATTVETKYPTFFVLVVIITTFSGENISS